MMLNKEERELYERRAAFMAKSGKVFDNFSIGLRKHLQIGQKYSYQRIPDKLSHYLYDSLLYLKYGKKISKIGDAYRDLSKCDNKFEQHPIHRGFFYDESRHALVGTATGIDINQSDGKHHILELNRSIGILEKIRPIYKTKYGPEIYNIVKFAKKYQFRKVYVMYSRLHLYRQEILDASEEFGLEMIPVSYPWVEFDKENYKHYFMPDTLEKDTLYMRLEPGYSPIMLYLSDKYISSEWMTKEISENPEAYSLINVPAAGKAPNIDPSDYDEQWPNLVVKLSGKGQGKAILMAHAKDNNQALAALNINSPQEISPHFSSSFTDKIVEKLFGTGSTVLYQDFVKPKLKDGKAGRIRINVFATPLESISLSDYYMWTVFDMPKKCPEGLIKDPRPYIVNWAFSGRKAQFEELTLEERKLTDAASPQICNLVQRGLEAKFMSE